MIYTNILQLPNKFYLFSYGANYPKQIAKTLRINDNTIKHLSIGVQLYGYRREFFGNSKRWDGAIATITPKAMNDCVQGMILLIEKKNNKYYVHDKEVDFINLLNREEFPNTYIINLVGYYNDLPILAFVVNPVYIKNNPNKIKKVNKKYLDAIIKTVDIYDNTKINYTRDNKILDIYYLNNKLPSSKYSY